MHIFVVFSNVIEPHHKLFTKTYLNLNIPDFKFLCKPDTNLKCTFNKTSHSFISWRRVAYMQISLNHNNMLTTRHQIKSWRKKYKKQNNSTLYLLWNTMKGAGCWRKRNVKYLGTKNKHKQTKKIIIHLEQAMMKMIRNINNNSM